MGYYRPETIQINVDSDYDYKYQKPPSNEWGPKIVKCFEWINENPKEINFILVALLLTLLFIIYIIIF